jgi:hypothetical protein
MKRQKNKFPIFKKLGIYDEHPEKDKKMNDELKLFLKSIVCNLAQINIRNKY